MYINFFSSFLPFGHSLVELSEHEDFDQMYSKGNLFW